MPDSDKNPFRQKPQTTEQYLEGMYDTLQRVLDQVTKTNGRVAELEEWRAQVEQQQELSQRGHEAFERGFREARKNMPMWTWKHTAATGLVASLAASIATFIFRIAELL